MIQSTQAWLLSLTSFYVHCLTGVRQAEWSGAIWLVAGTDPKDYRRGNSDVAAESEVLTGKLEWIIQKKHKNNSAWLIIIHFQRNGNKKKLPFLPLSQWYLIEYEDGFQEFVKSGSIRNKNTNTFCTAEMLVQMFWLEEPTVRLQVSAQSVRSS